MAAGSADWFRDNEDLRFQFRHGLGWEELVPLAEDGFSDPEGFQNLREATGFYEEALGTLGRFVAAEVAPCEAQLDREGARLVDGEVVYGEALRRIDGGLRELGFYGLSVPRALGGMGAPAAVYFAAGELLSRGDASLAAHFGFRGGIAEALLGWGAREGSSVYEDGRLVSARFGQAVRELATGEAWGCMALTEPGAGSDLAAIATRAAQRRGRWEVDGEKCFVSCGDARHQLVLARTEEAPGLDGLSLLLVTRGPGVRLTGLDQKLGQRAVATVSLEYRGAPAELVGRRGEGFRQVLSLMNAARVGVGLQAVGIAEGALRRARAFAAERRTMGRPIDRHELIAEKLFEAELQIAGLRALAFEAVDATGLARELALKLQCSPPIDPGARARLAARHEECSRRARRLTPLLKYLAAERCVAVARDALQIFGGAGYLDSTGVHGRLRDALALPVYEGTSQIQALMAVKDQLASCGRDPAGFVASLARSRLLARTARGAGQRALHRAESLVLGAFETLLLRSVGRKARGEWERELKGRAPAEAGRFLARGFLRRWDPVADFSPALLHAERLTRMSGDLAIAQRLFAQAGRFPERRALAERFLHRALVRIEAASAEVERDDGAVLEALAARGEGGSAPRS